MFCPACGVAASEEQKFCRACGMHLEVVYHLVAEHVQEEPPASEPQEKRHPVQKLGLLLSLSGGGAFIVLAFIILLVLASADAQAKLWNPLWTEIAAGAFGLLFIGLCLFRLPWLYRKFFPQTRRETAQLELIDTTPLSAERASGMEHTTQSLDSVSSH